MIVAVNMGEPVAKVRAYVAQHRLSFPQLLDPDNTLARMFSVRATPTNFLIDREGHIVAGGMGYRDWRMPEAHRLIESLLTDGVN